MSGSLEYTADGLDGDVSYDVQVRAVNSEGSGEWSTTSTGTPLIGAPTIDSVIVGDGDSSSRSNAQSISLGDQRNGLIDPLGDVDWFTFTLTQQTTVIVRGSSRIDGEILNSSGNSIDDVESVNLPASGFVHLADLAAGKYYIEVKPASVFLLRRLRRAVREHSRVQHLRQGLPVRVPVASQQRGPAQGSRPRGHQRRGRVDHHPGIGRERGRGRRRDAVQPPRPNRQRRPAPESRLHRRRRHIRPGRIPRHPGGGHHRGAGQQNRHEGGCSPGDDLRLRSPSASPTSRRRAP